MANGKRFTFADMQNPLFIHPSDGPLSVSVSKLQGASDYRMWKRSFEIQLSAKRKLGFLTGSVLRDANDVVQAAQWDTCNDLVISWIHSNVSDSIKQSIKFINSASEVWSRLEKHFLLSNGSRKYKLNRDLFALKQNNMKLNEYYTTLSSLWEEIESMNTLPVITTIAADVTAFISAIDMNKAESRLFQFLNGLDDVYAALRSQLLMQNPLPNVEVAFSTLQQEESQKDLFTLATTDAAAMFGKSQTEYKGPACHACGQKNHSGKKAIYSPLDANLKLKLKHDEGALLQNPQHYHALVGSLLYVNITRPDIAFSVGLVSRFMQEPRKPHLKAARQILKYVNSTLDLGMCYKKGSKFSLNGYSDASLGGDSKNGRSTSGYVFLCGGIGISWFIKKQDSVSLSTGEAEYKASSLAARSRMYMAPKGC